MPRFNYIELPSKDIATAQRFYADAFGFSFTQFGPDYASTMTGDTDIGLDGSPERKVLPLPVIDVDDLETAYTRLVGAGGRISCEIFAFPGGRRFHFIDPDGHELAVAQIEPM